MSGKYSGLQARIRERNPLADCIPCFAHSLNLVNIYAASKFFEEKVTAFSVHQLIGGSF